MILVKLFEFLCCRSVLLQVVRILVQFIKVLLLFIKALRVHYNKTTSFKNTHLNMIGF